jgi:hypothetical protein
MTKKHWYTVIIVAEKTVRIYAEDLQDAKDKAYEKHQPLWSAESALREDGTIE